MKICLVSDQFASTKSGIGVHTRNLVQKLTELGHEILLITNDTIKHENETNLNIIYVKRPMWDKTHGCWFSLALWLSNNIRTLHHKHKFEIFHSLDARQGALAAKKLNGVALTVGNVNDYYFAACSANPLEFIKEYKSDWFQRYIYYQFTKLFEKTHLNNFDLLIANSDATLNHIGGTCGIASQKIIKMHKALPGLPKEQNKISDKKDSNYGILLIGGNLQRKGIFYLIRAAPAIVNEFPNVEFKIVGEYKKEFSDECEKYRVKNNFKFYGWLPNHETRLRYAEADIFILPSLIEGFGITLLEAMSYGLPVICSRACGAAEIIKDGYNGLLIPAKSEHAIATAALRLLQNVKLRKQLSKNALDTVKDFSVENQIKKTLELYSVLRQRMTN